MATGLENSIFAGIVKTKPMVRAAPVTLLGGVIGSRFAPDTMLDNLPIVILDFETTGLSADKDRIIEFGAIKYENRKEVAVFSELADPGVGISANITRVTHITQDMLDGKRRVEKITPEFHDFIRGSLLVAHNAEFDVGFLAYESARVGISCAYHVVCSLKMARALVKNDAGKGLDALSQHYNLSFEARHRSIGDIRVTAEVLWRMLDENKFIRTLRDLELHRVQMPAL